MKKLTLIASIVTTCFLLFLVIDTQADCVSCDGYLDNGKCDKSDINNKVCISGGPADCFTSSCPGANEQ